MNRPSFRRVGAVAVFTSTVILGACGQPQPPPITPEEQAQMPPVVNPVDYPKGPYGYQVGSVIANLEFVGQSDTNHNGVIDSGDTVTSVRLSDYYAKKDIKAIFLGVAAGWCGPCMEEQPTLVALAKSYQGKIQFVEAIIEKGTRGVPADAEFVDFWAGRYKIGFDMVSDPTVVLGPYYAMPAFPMQLVIRTSDMTIQYQNNGTGPMLQDDLKGVFDAAIAGK